MSQLIYFGCWVLAIWLIRHDTARREGISSALWIPTLWAGILLSKPLSSWAGFGGSEDTLEGSPLDRLFFVGMIFLSLTMLVKRNVQWTRFISQNWPVFLFYGYLLVSVLWAESPFVSFKRWFKDFGNIFVAGVILTELNPQQAFRAVFARSAYLFLPLSVVLIRYFPALGRYYSRSGGLEITGVTTQKNSLGALVLVCGLVLLWDWFERNRSDQARLHKIERFLPFGFFLIGAYLLYLCNSKTSILCLILGAAILLSIKLPLLRDRVGALGGYFLAALAGFFLLDWFFGIKEAVVGAMGRDMTFTGRTDVWRELLALKTDPLIGTGFCSIWSNKLYLSQLPDWVAHSAHNGYLETYIDGGMIGVFFLALMLLVIAIRTNRQLAVSGNYALIRFATLVAILIGDFSESHFARMSPLWFLFLLTALEVPRRSEATAEPMVRRSLDASISEPVAEPVAWLYRS